MDNLLQDRLITCGFNKYGIYLSDWYNDVADPVNQIKPQKSYNFNKIPYLSDIQLIYLSIIG